MSKESDKNGKQKDVDVSASILGEPQSLEGHQEEVVEDQPKNENLPFSGDDWRKDASEQLLHVIMQEREGKDNRVTLVGPSLPKGKGVLFPARSGTLNFSNTVMEWVDYPSRSFVGHMAPSSIVDVEAGALSIEDVKRAVFPLGLTLIIADTGGGKTVLIKHLFSSLPKDIKRVMAINMGEPEAYLHGDEYTLCRSLVMAAQYGADVVLVDSFRTLFNEMGGSLKSQGISRSWDGFLSSVDRTARYLGLKVIATLNPSTDLSKNAKQDLFLTAKASCSGSIMINSSHVHNESLVMELSCHSRDKRRDYATSVAVPMFTSVPGKVNDSSGFLDFNLFNI